MLWHHSRRRRVLEASGRNESGVISAEDLDWLLNHLVSVKRVSRLTLPGLKPERAPVFAGGVCILMAVFKSLGLKEITPWVWR